MIARRSVIYWMLLGLAVMAVFVFLDRRGSRKLYNPPRPVEPRGELADFEKTTISIFTSASPCVVYIFTENAVSHFFGVSEIKQGAGSGLLWDRNGHVVTNLHVIKGSRRIQVRLDSGEAIDADFVGGTAEYDLAVIRLRDVQEVTQPIPIGSSSDLRVGQAVFAIGNPFGLSRSLTTGIISALDRRLPTQSGREVFGFIQTDAAINPGNSGGPLLDSAGRLIGVNTAIISESGSSAGIGFAVPVDVVNEIVPQLISNGKITRPGIGITVLNDEAAAELGVVGVVIDRVLPGSEADLAGLAGIDYAGRRLGDVIVGVNGQQVELVSDFIRILQQQAIGQTIVLQVQRNGQARTVEVKIMDIS